MYEELESADLEKIQARLRRRERIRNAKVCLAGGCSLVEVLRRSICDAAGAGVGDWWRCRFVETGVLANINECDLEPFSPLQALAWTIE